MKKFLQKWAQGWQDWLCSLSPPDLVLLSWLSILFLLGTYLYIFQPVLP